MSKPHRMSFGVRSGLPTRLSDSHYKQMDPLLMHFNFRTSFNSLLAGLLIANFTATAVLAQAAQSDCGAIRLNQPGQYGPYDYRTDKSIKSKLGIVEDYHFTPAVEALVRGSNNELPGPDLSYTLV